MLAFTLATMLAAATQSAAETATAPPSELIWAPEWRRRPTGADMERVYPRRAIAQNASGAVLLTCTLTASGKLEDCETQAEAPKDLGFEAAARELAKRFSAKPLQPANHKRSVMVPIGFHLIGNPNPSADLVCFAASPDFAEALTPRASEAGPGRRYLVRAVAILRAWGSTEAEALKWVEFTANRAAAVPGEYASRRAQCIREAPRP